MGRRTKYYEYEILFNKTAKILNEIWDNSYDVWDEIQKYQEEAFSILKNEVERKIINRNEIVCIDTSLSETEEYISQVEDNSILNIESDNKNSEDSNIINKKIRKDKQLSNTPKIDKKSKINKEEDNSNDIIINKQKQEKLKEINNGILNLFQKDIVYQNINKTNSISYINDLSYQSNISEKNITKEYDQNQKNQDKETEKMNNYEKENSNYIEIISDDDEDNNNKLEKNNLYVSEESNIEENKLDNINSYLQQNVNLNFEPFTFNIQKRKRGRPKKSNYDKEVDFLNNINDKDEILILRQFLINNQDKSRNNTIQFTSNFNPYLSNKLINEYKELNDKKPIVNDSYKIHKFKIDI